MATAQTAAEAWRYDLRSGDHLIYRYTFERENSGPDIQTHSRTTFTTHVVVVGAQNGRLSVGFQRNRETSELLAYHEKGKDTLARQRPAYEQILAKRPARFAEANEFSVLGAVLNYWQAALESPSKILMAVHEIEALPEKPVAIGDHWKGNNILESDFHFVAMENVAGKSCARVEGDSATAHLRYWWCPETRVIAKMEFDGEYGVFSASVHEKLSFELQDYRQGEAVADWLKSPDTQRAAMEALMLSHWVPLSAAVLQPALASSDAETQALALAVIYQRRLEVSNRDALASFAQNTNPEVKRIADEILNQPSRVATRTVQGCSLPQPNYAVQKTGTSLRVMQSDQFKGLPYMLHVPMDYRGDRPFPLLIYLSGGSGLAMDGVNTAENVVASTDYLVLYPQAGDLWWKSDMTARVAALLQETLQNLNVDTSRVYITGFSNGGTGALYYASLWPQRFAAVASLMGAGACMPELEAGLPNLTNIPFLFVHGDSDPIIPPHCSTQTYEALGKLSPRVLPEIHILKNHEHDITLENDEGLTLPFLVGKVRNPFPTKISARFVDMLYPRRYWVELLEKGGGVAEVEGQIKPDNTVELTTRNVKRLRLLLRPELFSSAAEIRIRINKKELFRGQLKQDCKVLQESSVVFADPQLGYFETMEFNISK